MKTILWVALLGMLLTSCQLTRVEGEIDDVDIKVSTDESHNPDYTFCPPGLGKKGNCE